MADPYIGEIRMFGGSFAPYGWSLCNGAVLLITQYSTLYSLIGNKYGGDGRTTFALPDLRGRVPVGMGQLSGGQNYALGAMGGEESVSLISSEVPPHSHPLNANAVETNSPSPSSSFPGSNGFYSAYTSVSTSGLNPMSAAAVGIGGGSLPHSNLMPSVVINFIICIFGDWPAKPGT